MGLTKQQKIDLYKQYKRVFLNSNDFKDKVVEYNAGSLNTLVEYNAGGNGGITINNRAWNTGMTQSEVEALINSKMNEIKPVYDASQKVYVPLANVRPKVVGDYNKEIVSENFGEVIRKVAPEVSKILYIKHSALYINGDTESIEGWAYQSNAIECAYDMSTVTLISNNHDLKIYDMSNTKQLVFNKRAIDNKTYSVHLQMPYLADIILVKHYHTGSRFLAGRIYIAKKDDNGQWYEYAKYGKCSNSYYETENMPIVSTGSDTAKLRPQVFLSACSKYLYFYYNVNYFMRYDISGCSPKFTTDVKKYKIDHKSNNIPNGWFCRQEVVPSHDGSSFYVYYNDTWSQYVLLEDDETWAFYKKFSAQGSRDLKVSLDGNHMYIPNGNVYNEYTQ